MSKFRVSMDMDGVLYPFDQAWNAVCEAHGGKAHDFSEWINFSEVFGDSLVDEIWHDPTLFQIEKPYVAAYEMMQELAEMQDFVEVFIVTNPGRTIDITIPAKWNWVQKYFPWIDAYHFVTMHAKWFFKTDMIVDDFPGNVRKWLRQNPTGEAVMIEQPWNTGEITKIRNLGGLVMDLADVVDCICTVAD